MFCSFAGPSDTAYLEASAMNSARCRICWQPLPPLNRQCQRCGHIDTLRVTNILFERFVKVAGLVAIGLVVWAVIRHGIR
jgi:ribosomal protein L40E